MLSGYIERVKFRLKDWTVRNAKSPYAGAFLFVYALAESIFSPFPIEIVQTPLTIVRPRRWLYFSLVAAVATFLGGIAGFVIGMLFFDVLGDPLVKFYGFEDQLLKATTLLERHVFAATFIAAFTPIPWKIFTVGAGLLAAPLAPFLAAAAIGRTLRFVMFGYIVRMWGGAAARTAFRNFTLVTFTVLLFALMFLAVHVVSRF